ncbi:MAG: GIY-YIG nuclease family protein [Desulfuromonadaceae bacterium]|nr:GIY-YIG nuclease family protein [Desulfuromonadaceae bacterium]
MTKQAFVYILASKKNGTLYTGVTSNLEQRIYQHKHHLLEGFTSKYDVTRLVWFAHGDDIASAIRLEKKIKNRNRQWKIDLIEKSNPDWVDLAADWIDSGPCDFAQGDKSDFAQGDKSDFAQGDKSDFVQDVTIHPVIPRAVAESIARNDDGECL